MAMGAKRLRVKTTFLGRLRQAGAKVARLVKTAVPSLICGSDVTGMPPAQLNDARLVARKICREKTYHRCFDLDLMLKDAGTHCGRRGATSAILMWQCAWVERWVPALWMTKTLLVASDRPKCTNPWKLASAVVAMMRFGSQVLSQVLSGTEFGTHKGVLSFASVGNGEPHAVLQDAYDRWTCERACHRILALALVGGPPFTVPLKLAMQHVRSSPRGKWHIPQGNEVGMCCKEGTSATLQKRAGPAHKRRNPHLRTSHTKSMKDDATGSVKFVKIDVMGSIRFVKIVIVGSKRERRANVCRRQTGRRMRL